MNGSVLEIACGTGYWTQFIAPVASRVLAIDSAPETLAIARSRVHDEKVRFDVGDAYALPSHHGLFQAVFAGFWFSHVPRQRWGEFLRGVSKCLRPHGKVVFLDNTYVEGSSSPITGEDSEGNTYQTRHLRNSATYQVLKNFPSEAEVSKALADVGRAIRYTHWEYYWAIEYTIVATR